MHNLLHGRWTRQLAGVLCSPRCNIPFGNDRSSLPLNSRSDMVGVCAVCDCLEKQRCAALRSFDFYVYKEGAARRAHGRQEQSWPPSGHRPISDQRCISSSVSFRLFVIRPGGHGHGQLTSVLETWPVICLGSVVFRSGHSPGQLARAHQLA